MTHDASHTPETDDATTNRLSQNAILATVLLVVFLALGVMFWGLAALVIVYLVLIPIVFGLFVLFSWPLNKES